MWSAASTSLWLLSLLAQAPPAPLPRAAQFPGAQPAPLPPPLAMAERLRYRVAFGVLEVGRIQVLSAGRPRPGEAIVGAIGYGEGALLGFGRVESHAAAEFDARLLSSRRWSSARLDDARTGFIRDLGDQPLQGEVEMTRERAGAATERQRASWPTPTLDVLGFVLRVRVAPPPAGSLPQVLQVLDGKALWRVTLTNSGRELLPDPAGPRAALRIDGRAEPIFYDGTLDDHGDRASRAFVLWLSDDPAHVPLRMEMPLGFGSVVVTLVDAVRRPR